MKLLVLPFAAAASALLPGCIAKTALDVATAPVKIASKTVDMATTSQSEADEKRGRDLRKRQEQLGKLERSWRKLDDQCRAGNDDACWKRDKVSDEIERIRPTVPMPYSD